MGWALLICVALGAVCGLWIHVFVFALLTLVVFALYVASSLLENYPLTSAILSGLYLWWALGAGFVLGHIFRHVLRTRLSTYRSKNEKLDQVHKYMED